MLLYRNKLVLLLALIGLQLFSQEEERIEWHTLNCSGAPKARHEATFIKVHHKFYLLGGRKIKQVSIFNPKNNTWTQGKKPPIELHHFQGVIYKNKVYVAGAFTGKYPREIPVSEIYSYDTKKDIWSESIKIPEDRLRGAGGTVIYKNKLYLVGGLTDGHWDGHVKWFDCYDFKTQKWSKLPDAPRHRDHFNAVIANDKLFLVGGRVSSGKTKQVFELTVNEIDVFDFKTNTWSTLNLKLPTPRAGCAAISYKDNIIVAGGESISQKEAHNEVEVFNLSENRWINYPSLNRGRHGTQLVFYKGKLYIASGSGNRGGSPELESIERLQIK